MKPHQIISLMTFEGADNTFAMGDHDDHIHVGFRPLYGANTKAARRMAAVLKPDQWVKLIDRISEIDNPVVREQPSKFSVKVTKRASEGAPRRVALSSASPQLARARALLLLLDHVLDEPQDLGRAARLDGPRFERLAPVAHLAVLGQLVEVRARDGEAHLRVRRDVARDLRARQLDAEELDVAAATELELEHQLELLKRRHLLLEVQHGVLDEGLGLGGRHRCGILSLAMDYKHLRYEQDGPVTVITIDRPERMNAVGPTTARELVDAWTRFRDDEQALVAVLTGAGEDAFCAGGDLKAAYEGEHVVPIDAQERAAHARGEAPGILGPTRWTDLHKPTIAAVTASPTRAGWSGRAGPTSASPTSTRRSASPAGAGTSAWATAARSACPGSSACVWRWS